MTCVQYKDTITLVVTEPDNYGAEVLSTSEEVKAAIDLNTGYVHNSNQDNVTSDAIAYVDPEDEFVKAQFYRLEECLVLIDLFGTPEQRGWYKITSVNVARDTQLCNKIDNIELLLKKTAPLADIS